jgi:DNA-binding beta-propeller fold protein YncE
VAAAPDGTVFVADSYNHRIKRLDPATGAIVTVAGSGEPGAADGPLKAASFSEPGGLAVAGNLIYVADTNNHRVRVVDLTAGTVTTLTKTGTATVSR